MTIPCGGVLGTGTIPNPGTGTGDESGGDESGGSEGDVIVDQQPARCNEWDPNAHITRVGRTYVVNRRLVDRLVTDPSPLVLCDQARVKPYVHGNTKGFQVVRVSQGELLYGLGLRNGYIALALNGYKLETFDDAATAAVELYLRQRTTTFKLKYKKGPFGAIRKRTYKLRDDASTQPETIQ